MARRPPTAPRAPRDLWSFDRADRWSLVVLLGLVALVTLAVQVVLPLVGWARGRGHLARLPRPGRGAGARHGGRHARLPGPRRRHAHRPTAAQRLLDLLPGVLLTAVVVAGAWLVLRVLRDVAAGDPFRPRNVTRLRALAVLVAIGLPVVWFAQGAVDLGLLTSLDIDAGVAGVVVAVPWAPVVAGMLVALVAEAFKLGAGLRDDVEGLV